jgi:hypothetical protein
MGMQCIGGHIGFHLATEIRLDENFQVDDKHSSLFLQNFSYTVTCSTLIYFSVRQNNYVSDKHSSLFFKSVSEFYKMGMR